MKCECWESHLETAYWLGLDEDQILALASGSVPRTVKAMCLDVIHFAEQDEARAVTNRALATRKAKKPKVA